MKVVCKENTRCDFSKTCNHSKVHEHSIDCTYKNARCCDECVCGEEHVAKCERKEKLKKINENSTLQKKFHWRE